MMDFCTIVVTVLLAGSFFGFILWLAIHSRRTISEKPPVSDSEIDLSEVRLKNERFMTNSDTQTG